MNIVTVMTFAVSYAVLFDAHFQNKVCDTASIKTGSEQRSPVPGVTCLYRWGATCSLTQRHQCLLHFKLFNSCLKKKPKFTSTC